MAFVVLAHNGIGLGHLSRALVLCQKLRAAGVAPVIFAQGILPDWLSRGFAAKRVPALWRASSRDRDRVLADVVSSSRLSFPSVVFEDTHPIAEPFPEDVRRILLVRPTTFEYMVYLQESFGSSCESFWLADDPSSPTWVFDPSQTAAILSWPKWHIVGPIYRRASKSDCEIIRQKYSICADDRVCVFTMGGGGEHDGTADSVSFCRTAKAIGRDLRVIDPGARLIFVKGPYYSGVTADLDEFEIIEEEADMPALIACANGVVARPGFNTIWEAISAGIPLQCVPGTAWNEPTEERTRRLLERGLAVSSIAYAWKRELERTDTETLPPCMSGQRLTELIGRLSNKKGRRVFRRRARRALVVAINSVGIGHIMRSRAVVAALIEAGWDTKLVVESNSSPAWPEPTEPQVPRLRRDNKDAYLDAWSEFLENNDPDIVVFDTHTPPSQLLLNKLQFAHTYMLSSMPSEGLLARLLDNRGSNCRELILLHSRQDFSEMYGDKAIEAIEESQRATFAGGPIARRTPSSVVPCPAHPFMLIALGGGGEHSGSGDTRQIAHLANHAARHVAKNYGFTTVMVCGPLFIHRELLDEDLMFVHDFAGNLLDLASAASIVIARPGFNLSRELFNADTALVFLQTRQFDEATEANYELFRKYRQIEISSLGRESIVVAIDRALAAPRRRAFPIWEDGITGIMQRVSVASDDVALREMVVALEAFSRSMKQIILRVDDVTVLDDRLKWLISECQTREITPSLQVIPYLCEFDDRERDAIDPEGAIEVLQHGFSHQNLTNEGARSEFRMTDNPEFGDLDTLRRGMLIMNQRFGKRFRGGFSPPYDGCPSWLPAAWKELGGTFLSTIWAQVSSQLPLVSPSIETWNWRHDQRRATWRVAQETVRHCAEHGYAVLVLHQQMLSDKLFRRWLITFLDSCCTGRVEWSVLYRVAQPMSRRVWRSISRRYTQLEKALP